MSKINDLIKKLCPNGVNKYKLSDLVNFENGKGHERVVSDNGKYILLTSKAISSNLNSYRRTDQQLSPLYKNDITMVMSDLPNGKALAKCFLVDQDDLYTLNQRVCRLSLKVDNVSPKYLNYLLNRNSQLLKYDNGVDQTNLRKDDILKIELLIPPIEVQNEIVQILDKFGELVAELEAELEARKKQYEFWRSKVISKSNKKVKIGEICDVITGGEVPEDTIKGNEPDETHKYAVYGNGKEIYGYTSTYRIDKDSTVISSIGANTGAIYFHKAFFTPIVRLKVLVPKDNVNPRYLYHALQTVNFGSKSGSVPNLNANDIKNTELPYFEIDEQSKIVRALDKFDILINDISEGLPAEIELRRKQYEYYRNKLLSFEELSVSE